MCSITAAALALFLLAGRLDAQRQGGGLAIRGGRIHTLAGPPIEDGTVLIRNGRIAEVGTNVAVPAEIPIIDATGLEVYPGLFDAMSRLGLTEIGQVEVTNDLTELGEFNPHLSAATAIHPASEHIPVARANGITHAVSAPQARPAGIGGQATVINLDGWTIEEMMVQSSVGVVLNWPSLRTGGFGFFGEQQAPRTFREARERYERNVRRLEEWLEQARRYDAAIRAGQAVPRDLKLEALAKVVRRELPFLVGADQERDIRNAIEFMEKHNLRMILVGGRQAWKVRELLAEKRIPVIAGPTQTLPTGQDEGYDEMYAAPGLLYQAGVKFAFGTFSSSDSRTLPYEAGSAVSFGLPREQALRAITINGAEILGLEDQLGTLEVGKIANLIVTDGDPLEIRTQVKHVIIAGRDVGTDNRHDQLYQRYRARPLPETMRR
jgi:imidazolonepropionase-like amidohydrolase